MQMFRIKTFTDDPELDFSCVTSASGGRGILRMPITTHRATAEGMPEGLDCLIIAGDLQGYASSAPPVAMRELIGITIARELGELADAGILPDPLRTAVLLSGDLYAIPTLDKRGGLGDVLPVWRAFGERFGEVVGVAGNHDLFGSSATVPSRMPLNNLRVLDGELTDVRGLRVGGYCGVLGDSHKAWRRSYGDFSAALDLLREQVPDVLITHEPIAPPRSQRPGNIALTPFFKGNGPQPVMVCGHMHWDEPFLEFDGWQMINVDARVVIVTRA